MREWTKALTVIISVAIWSTGTTLVLYNSLSARQEQFGKENREDHKELRTRLDSELTSVRDRLSTMGEATGYIKGRMEEIANFAPRFDQALKRFEDLAKQNADLVLSFKQTANTLDDLVKRQSTAIAELKQEYTQLKAQCETQKLTLADLQQRLIATRTLAENATQKEQLANLEETVRITVRYLDAARQNKTYPQMKNDQDYLRKFVGGT